MAESKCIYCGEEYGEENLDKHQQVCPENRKAKALQKIGDELEVLSGADSLGEVSYDLSHLAGVISEIKDEL